MTSQGFHHKLPFLHRNWVAGINHAMGLRPCLRPDHDDDVILAARPAKRRRLSHDSSSGQPSPYPYDSARFYLPEVPGDLQRALRIDVLRIFHRDTSRVKFNRIFNGSAAPSAATTRARCRVTILSHDGGDSQIVFCDSQVCDVKTYKNPVGPSHMARIHLPQPFLVPQEKILVERTDDCVFDLADSYTMVLELEGAGDPNWPPSDLVKVSSDADVFSRRPVPSRFWVLSATIGDVFPRSRASISLSLKNKGWDDDRATDLVLDTDIRWTTGFSDWLVKKRLDEGVAQSITFVDPEDELPMLSGRVNGHVNGQLPNGHHPADYYATNGQIANGHAHYLVNGDVDDLDEDADGEVTPSRSLRARGASKVYNLKVLSDKAQGKERRRRRKLESRDDRAVEDGRVVYKVPPEHVTLEGLVCCVCGAINQSANQLRAHFLCHPRYDFEFEDRQGKGPLMVRVSLNADIPGTSIRPRIYQLGRPTKLLDLDKYLEGDHSWVTSRYGPENGVAVVERIVPARPLQPKTAVRRNEKKPVVPNIKQRLFDPLSKALLEAGADVPRTLCDDEWLIQKHRDHLQDFVDIAPSEKEYMKEWDAFVFKKRLSSEAYAVRAFGSFVAAKASWLVSSESRMQEFGKHLAVLKSRGSIGEQAVQEAMSLVNEAKNQRKASQRPEPVPSPTRAATSRKSLSGCAVCGRPVAGSSLLACSNKGCGRRLYHDECVRPTAKVPVNDAYWYCNKCARA